MHHFLVLDCLFKGELKRFFFPFPSEENRLLLSSSQGTVGISSSRQPNAGPGT